MTGLRVLLILTALATTGALLRMLRRNHLREKYAVLWLGLAPVVIVLAAFPFLLNDTARAIGIAAPPNLLFFAASLVLLLVSIRLSVEITGLEDETRALAEEVAILRAAVEGGEGRPSPGGRGAHGGGGARGPGPGPAGSAPGPGTTGGDPDQRAAR